jgi:dihydrodipicolinate synthase/N-acetylneuraminate lyase
MLRGALAAALTPLQAGGESFDARACELYASFLVESGLDGVLLLGTTGEGMLLNPSEREIVASVFTAAVGGRLKVAVHVGAQSTKDTVRLAEHAVSIGANAVAVIPPPYFRLDDGALLAHLDQAARAAAPLPFYLYEFEAASGYAISHEVIQRFADIAPNLAGLKVSDAPYPHFERYLGLGFDVLVGPEAFIGRGISAGAVGAVSALASALPELVVAAVRDRSDRVGDLRAIVDCLPRHAALKYMVRRRGVGMAVDVRAPLRGLTAGETRELDEALETWLGSAATRPLAIEAQVAAGESRVYE